MRPLHLDTVTHVVVSGNKLPVAQRFNDTGMVIVTAPADFPIPRQLEKQMQQWPARAKGYPLVAYYKLNVAGLPLIRGAVT